MDTLSPFVDAWQPTALAHNDFYDDQMLFTPDTGRLALVDFEETAPGDPLLDVGVMLAHLRRSAVRRFARPTGESSERRRWSVSAGTSGNWTFGRLIAYSACPPTLFTSSTTTGTRHWKRGCLWRRRPWSCKRNLAPAAYAGGGLGFQQLWMDSFLEEKSYDLAGRQIGEHSNPLAGACQGVFALGQEAPVVIHLSLGATSSA